MRREGSKRRRDNPAPGFAGQAEQKEQPEVEAPVQADREPKVTPCRIEGPTQPKAGHVANQEAKTCADAILRLLQGKDLDTNIVTNSACYTPITATTATWLSAVYQYKQDPTTGAWKMAASTENGVTQPRSALAATTENYSDMIKWFNTLMRDTFS